MLAINLLSVLFAATVAARQGTRCPGRHDETNCSGKNIVKCSGDQNGVWKWNFVESCADKGPNWYCSIDSYDKAKCFTS
ncbi:hypothetical protein C8034_v008671 [Colletotrichum sidae]|uniref:Secreted protein n=2 Tax=Colletotrichum orbiculare species complex TaxID=2707354 RepID=A0A4R8QQ00_9PEZI|nr:hypothetical protein C8035_v003288 [Colletotrichum spinosum]TEA20477.1 hypothetical protein C8034_v008671 [Colletotrichum sidae]